MAKTKEELEMLQKNKEKIAILEAEKIAIEIKKPKNEIVFPGIILDLNNASQLKQFQETYAKSATPQELGMFIAIIKTT
jgi:hypothetical protein